MLCLSRGQEEVILIETLEGLIEIKVLAVRPGQVRLGIEAPPSQRIVRAEIAGRPPRIAREAVA
jgi:carbon storage regulator CsrA